MAKSKLVEANEKIAEKVTDTFGKIEDAVVGEYSKIENSVVGGYSKIEDAFVERYLAKDGETVEEAKKTLEKRKSRVKPLKSARAHLVARALIIFHRRVSQVFRRRKGA